MTPWPPPCRRGGSSCWAWRAVCPSVPSGNVKSSLWHLTLVMLCQKWHLWTGHMRLWRRVERRRPGAAAGQPPSISMWRPPPSLARWQGVKETQNKKDASCWMSGWVLRVWHLGPDQRAGRSHGPLHRLELPQHHVPGVRLAGEHAHALLWQAAALIIYLSIHLCIYLSIHLFMYLSTIHTDLCIVNWCKLLKI